MRTPAALLVFLVACSSSSHVPRDVTGAVYVTWPNGQTIQGSGVQVEFLHDSRARPSAVRWACKESDKWLAAQQRQRDGRMQAARTRPDSVRAAELNLVEVASMPYFFDSVDKVTKSAITETEQDGRFHLTIPGNTAGWLHAYWKPEFSELTFSWYVPVASGADALFQDLTSSNLSKGYPKIFACPDAAKVGRSIQ